MGIGSLRRHYKKPESDVAVTADPSTDLAEKFDRSGVDEAAVDDAAKVADETATSADETAEAVAEDTTADADTTTPQTADSGPDKPKGNASLEAWTAYALANGYTADDLGDASRDQIAALFKD